MNVHYLTSALIGQLWIMKETVSAYSRCHLVETLFWFDLVFCCFFVVFCLFGVFYLFFFFGGVVFGFLPFFLYFGRRIISAWGNPWYILVCLMIQKVLDVVVWWIVLLRISVLFEQFLVTAERVNCIRKLNPFNLFFYIL